MNERRLIFVLFTFMLANATALSLSIQPAQSSTTNFDNKPCGSVQNFPFTISNNGDGGVLCWYTTSDNSVPTKLTSACLHKSQTQQYTAQISMPSSTGSKTITVQLECFDFWNDWTRSPANTDTCTDNVDYSTAKVTKFSGGKDDSHFTIAPRMASASCTAVSFSINPSIQSLSMYNGESRQVVFNVVNSMQLPLTCTYSGAAGSGPIGTVAASSTQPFTVTIKAPDSGQSTTMQSGLVLCTEPASQQTASQPFQVTLSFQQDPAVSSITAAQGAINSGNTQLQTTEKSIQDETTKGVDTTASMGLLQQAKSLIQQAQTAFASATSAKQNGDSTSAKTYGDQALQLAQQASSMNGQILSKLEEEKKEFASGKQEASNLINTAKSKIAESESWVQRSEAVVANATSLGMDTVSAKTQIQSAKSSLSNAKSYLSQATSSFDSKNYQLSKSNANTAIQNSGDGQKSAETAFNSLNDVVQKASIASSLMVDANSEIQKADQTYIKLTNVVRETRKYADVSAVESDITAQKAVIDQAKDAASSAQNKFNAGYYDPAVSSATDSRDKAASAKNRLDRVVERLTNTIKDALDKAVAEASQNKDAANSAIQGASSTYGAPADKITSAQEKIKNAQIDLQSAQAQVSDAKSTASLSSFLDKAATAFETVKTASAKSSEAKTDADAAKNDALTKIGVGGAAAVGTAGAGLLYWRRKKKGGASEKKEVKPSEEKPAVEPEPKELRCPKCKKELLPTALFCPSCGKKLSPKPTKK